jgi:glycosyltransferase involved in cell wall biosynthesis
MTARQLHIVSFDIPYPPSYGGVIDVFYKLKALAAAGITITLHTFYKGHKRIPEALEECCAEIHLYPRRMQKRKAIGTTPFIIASRYDESLLQRLEQDDAPILLEGMHTAALLGHPALAKRLILLRMHNIEWDYYRQLARQEATWWKKCYFYMEALRLKQASAGLEKAGRLLAISQQETAKLSLRYVHTEYLPPFHGHNIPRPAAGRGDYCLYHGNLSVIENRKAVEFLLRDVFSSLDVPLRIAGSQAPVKWLDNLKSEFPYVQFISEPSEEELQDLIRHAQVNTLASMQSTGVKLKLINALFLGRHVITNPPMVHGSSLERICHVAADDDAYRELVVEMMDRELTEDELTARKTVLGEEFNDAKNAQRLIKWLYPDR